MDVLAGLRRQRGATAAKTNYSVRLKEAILGWAAHMSCLICHEP